MGGGVTRLSLRITNVGFRLLRSSVRVEPQVDSRWVKLLSGADGLPFQTIDQTEIPVEVELPETIDGRLARDHRHRKQRGHAAGRSSASSDRLTRCSRLTPAAAWQVWKSPSSRESCAGGWRESARWCEWPSAVARVPDFGFWSALMNVGSALGSGNRLAEPRITFGRTLHGCGRRARAGWCSAKRRGEPRDLLTAGLAGGLLGLLSSAPSVLDATDCGARPRVVVDVDRGRLSLVGGAWVRLLALGSTVFLAHPTQDRQVSP